MSARLGERCYAVSAANLSPSRRGSACVLVPRLSAVSAFWRAYSPPAPRTRKIRDRPMFADSTRSSASAVTKASWNAPVAIDALPAEIRGKIAKVVQSPTMTAHGPAEEFPANFYDWLVDHPDRVALAWRRLGVPCVGITNHGNGTFGWTDGQGSDLTWRCAYTGPARVWFAEGQAG